MPNVAAPAATSRASDLQLHRELDAALLRLRAWIEARDYSGYEPYDALNSPLLSGWARRQPFATLFIQTLKRVGGLSMRQLLRIPPSKNPKALALMLSGYCDLARCGIDVGDRVTYLKDELKRLRSPNESEYCWGYDWHYVSMRGAELPRFSPNCIATYFAGSALLDMAEQFGDAEARTMAESVGRFITTRLPRSIDTADQLCISYVPAQRTIIYNNSVLAAALLARLAARDPQSEYRPLARRAMRFLADNQLPDGGWAYGQGRMQGWIDSFHTAYNIGALDDYRQYTGDTTFDENISRGFRYYAATFFLADGTPKYFNDSTYPVDIHCCSQALITFSDFASDPSSAALAERVAAWTLARMTYGETFYYQRHRLFVDRTPYMRWSQAWMFRALARMKRVYFPEVA